jgi:hypothetical protein
MDTHVMLTIGTCLVGIITAIMVGFIPWAYRINGRLTANEVQLKFVLEALRSIEKKIPE